MGQSSEKNCILGLVFSVLHRAQVTSRETQAVPGATSVAITVGKPCYSAQTSFRPFAVIILLFPPPASNVASTLVWTYDYFKLI